MHSQFWIIPWQVADLFRSTLINVYSHLLTLLHAGLPYTETQTSSSQSTISGWLNPNLASYYFCPGNFLQISWISFISLHIDWHSNLSSWRIKRVWVSICWSIHQHHNWSIKMVDTHTHTYVCCKVLQWLPCTIYCFNFTLQCSFAIVYTHRARKRSLSCYFESIGCVLWR